MSVATATAFALTPCRWGQFSRKSAAYMQSTAGNGSWMSLLAALVLSLLIRRPEFVCARSAVSGHSCPIRADGVRGDPVRSWWGFLLFLAYSRAQRHATTVFVWHRHVGDLGSRPAISGRCNRGVALITNSAAALANMELYLGAP